MAVQLGVSLLFAKRGMCGVLIALMSVLAGAGCRPEGADEMEAVYNQVYDSFETGDVNSVVNGISRASIEEYATYRDLALNATPEQVKQLPAWFLFDTLVMRARATRADLEGKDARTVLITAVEKRWYRSSYATDPARLTNFKISGDSAEAEVWYDGDDELSTKACFVLEDGVWKYDFPSSGSVSDRYTARDANAAGMSVHDYMIAQVSVMVGRELGPEIYEPMK